MKLEVGMYARTDEGIFKISHINILFDDSDYKKVLLTHKEKVRFASVDYIRKLKPQPSFDIIDLIEVGDYVNGYKVDFVQNGYVVFNHNHPYQLNIYSKDIKSIVTKEQFESMSYKVVEE